MLLVLAFVGIVLLAGLTIFSVVVARDMLVNRERVNGRFGDLSLTRKTQAVSFARRRPLSILGHNNHDRTRLCSICHDVRLGRLSARRKSVGLNQLIFEKIR